MGVEWPTLQEPLGTGLPRASVLHMHELSPTLRTGSNEMVVELGLTYLVLARCFLNANFTVIFVHSGCCNKVPYTWWFISLRNLFLGLQNLGCPRSRPWLLWCQVMALILVQRQDYSLCLLMAERRRGSSLGLFLWGHRSDSWGFHLPQALLPDTITLGLELNKWMWDGGPNPGP